MKLTARKLFFGMLACAVAGAVVFAFLPKPVHVDVAAVTSGPLSVTVDEDGKTRIKERYLVYTPLAGRLMRIELKVGDTVTAGQSLLAVVEPGDPSLLDARARAQTVAKVKATEAALKRAAPQLEQALVAMQFAESEHSRARKLAERQTISQNELEIAALLEQTRTQEYKAAKFAEEIARFELDLAKAALLRTQPESESEADGQSGKWNFQIRSPITGRVLRVFQESSAVLSAGTRLMELGDPADLELEIDVLSSDAVKIRPGAKVSLEHWGGEKTLAGIVRLVEPSAFTKISALGVEEQRVNIIADLIDSNDKRAALGDGFRVEAKIVVWDSPDVIKVPTSALFRRGEDWAVFVVEQGHAEVRIVNIDHRTGLAAEVLEGLTEQDQVIVYPSDRVQDGVEVVAR